MFFGTALHRRKFLSVLKNPRFIFSISVLFILLFTAMFANQLALFDPENANLSQRLEKPSWSHFFGCDIHGRDLFSLVVLGARLTVFIVFATVTLSTSVGVIAGILAGYFRGLIDILIMRLVDILMAFPGILLAMALSAFLGPSIQNVIFAISITGWTSTARLVRAQVLAIREHERIVATQALGAKPLRILRWHILPFLWTPLLVSTTFSLSGVILIEASLSFLGLGVNTGIPTWGGLLYEGRSVLEEAPFLSIIPGALIVLVVLSINFLGDVLRDLLDPRL